MKLEGKKVLVVGAGKSGIAASELLLDKKIETVLYDGNKDLDVEKLYEKAPKLKGMPVLLGELTDEQLRAFDVAVLSPGVPTDLPVVERMRAQNVCIWGEIELAYSFAKGRLIAITGTNGKTTTTALTGEIMKNYFKDVRVVGNIGIPYTSEAATMTDETVTVAEISSFQLETIEEFAPQVSAILNITEDHLNRHHTMEEYIRVKELIVKNQKPEDYCILNYEDPVLREFGQNIVPKTVYFSSVRKLDEGIYLDGDLIVLKTSEEEIPLVPGDPERLKQVFLNILDNAAKYACDGKTIEVSVFSDTEAATIQFRDHGPGIPDSELPHVKEKFFKGEKHKARGSGIGLAVCDEIVTRSGGTLTIGNAPGGGTLVSVRLPFAAESST